MTASNGLFIYDRLIDLLLYIVYSLLLWSVCLIMIHLFIYDLSIYLLLYIIYSLLLWSIYLIMIYSFIIIYHLFIIVMVYVFNYDLFMIYLLLYIIYTLLLLFVIYLLMGFMTGWRVRIRSDFKQRRQFDGETAVVLLPAVQHPLQCCLHLQHHQHGEEQKSLQ